MTDQKIEAAVATARPDEKPLLFISHRHDDKPIADVLREFIRTWTNKGVDVHQSSSPDADGPRPGKPLKKELTTYLWEASVLLLIYTTRDRDWSYCMWECGVAQLPQPQDTNTIVLKVTDQSPAAFDEQLHVALRERDAIETLVNRLLTDPGFFPKLGKAATDFEPHSGMVKRAASELWENLQQALPDPVIKDEEWPPFPQLTIALSDEQVKQIRQGGSSDEEKLAVAQRVIFEESSVVGGDKQIGSIFGVQGIEQRMPGIPMRRLIDSWRSSTPTPKSKWADDLAAQIVATLDGRYPTARWQLMRGVDRDNTSWFGPVVRYFKRSAADGAAEIDVTFCKFRLDDEGRPRIEVCEAEERD